MKSPLTEGANSFFSRYAGMYARRFRKHGLERVQKLLLEGVRTRGVSGKEILDIGCGVGALHLTLLKEGAAHATGVDMSEGMIARARGLSRDLGVDQKTTYVVGDFVEVAAQVSDADVTLLDKSVCCYENLSALVLSSLARTRGLYVLSHPKQNLLMRFAFRGHIVLAKLFHWKFHPYWHDWKRLRQEIGERGFELVSSPSTPMWQVLLFQRT